MTCKFCGTTLTEGERALGFDYCAGNPDCVSKADAELRELSSNILPVTHCRCGQELDEYGMCVHLEHNYL